jgi:hypothetical protein
MKNARIVAMMFVAAFAMSAASAQEVAANRTSSNGLSMYEPATAVSGPAEQPSAVESGAKKLGSFFGGLVKAPVRVAKALAGGVKEGYSQPSATSQDQGGSAIQQNGSSMTSQATSLSTSTASRTPQEMRQRITQVFARAKSQGMAPVEDRSVSAGNATTKAMSSSAKLSTWKEQPESSGSVAFNQLY